jgi:hypothetical protein
VGRDDPVRQLIRVDRRSAGAVAPGVISD